MKKLWLLANAHKLSPLGLNYLVRRSTLSEANQRRSSQVYGEIYMSVYRNHAQSLTNSRLSDADLKRLYIMDSSTLSLFKDILKGVGRNPKEVRKKLAWGKKRKKVSKFFIPRITGGLFLKNERKDANTYPKSIKLIENLLYRTSMIFNSNL